MQKQSLIFIVVGLSAGSLFGVFLGAAIDNPSAGVSMGALAGIFLGLYTAMCVQNQINKA